MIESVFDKAQLVIGNVAQVGVFGQILADEAVDLFIEAALPGLVGLGKIDFSLQFTSDGFMSGELPAVIGGNGVDPSMMAFEALGDLLSHGIGGFVDHLSQHGELAFSLDEADDGAAMVFADQGIGFPVAQAGLFFNHTGSPVNADTIGDLAAKIVFSIAFTFFLSPCDA